MNSKGLVTILITTIVVGGGVYFWQNQPVDTQQLSQENTLEFVSEDAQAVNRPTENNDVVEVAKNSSAEFLYLVSSPSYKETTAVLKDYLLSFSLKYPYNEWRQLYFFSSDLTASGGGNSNRFDGLVTYDFCAGSYFCDMTEKKGRGFQLKVWNATYPDRDENPDFYSEDGEIMVVETDDIIVTYKPYDEQNIAEAAAKLFESFELLQ